MSKVSNLRSEPDDDRSRVNGGNDANGNDGGDGGDADDEIASSNVYEAANALNVHLTTEAKPPTQHLPQISGA